MELARRNNGFRKVAKWIVGAVVVAGASSVNVLCDEVSEPQEAEVAKVNTESNLKKQDEEIREIMKDEFNEVIGRLPHDPAAVAIVNSRGKSFTNQDIYELIDHDIFLGFLSITLTEDQKQRVRERIVELNRQEMLDAISFFDQLLSELPAELAQEASKYSYLSELPEDLANAVKNYVKALNDRIEEQKSKIREEELQKVVDKMQKEGKQNMGKAGKMNGPMPPMNEPMPPMNGPMPPMNGPMPPMNGPMAPMNGPMAPMNGPMAPSEKDTQHNGIRDADITDGSMGKNPSENEDKKTKSKPWYKFW
ncbi:hypothetical protein BBOV_II000710 [Babesia bovis T2Bo]|uniref:Microprotein domain-containing protein n=1 Tax=Babesia bovis TaxID=5865 RepID=A7ASX0_BABBO|nr:hypothetical protein BBOV_II000710 [Babesia bovis T2Bo]EDO06031.1 hypothetical protein BBOV_II000710 [Babesia bovis T2Bo]BAN65330.1 hypothetical protein [Babesia bovis]|eukprot:XP_001609599.1 hypothetical protein [Babesia bovis T2Bo]